MDGQRAKLAPRRLDRVGTIPRAEPSTHPSSPAPPEPTVARTSRLEAPGDLSTFWAAVLGVGWPLAIVAWMELPPAPADPAAPVPVLISLAWLGLYFVLLTTAVAAGVRHRGAAVGALVTGLLAMTFTVTCPVSGHHALGLWWFGQLAIVTGMLALSAVAFQRTRR